MLMKKFHFPKFKKIILPHKIFPFLKKHRIFIYSLLPFTFTLLAFLILIFLNKTYPQLFDKPENSPSALPDNPEIVTGDLSQIIKSPCFVDGKSILERDAPNNKYGMFMIADSSNLSLKTQMTEIAKLVNSNGGDWGYVLTHLYTHNLNKKNWTAFFDLAAENHLIPIIQLQTATIDQNTMYANLQKTATFLNSFDWPSSCRYISVFNETNAKDYWQETLDPEGYAVILNDTINIFKTENENFYMMNGGFNTSCRNGPRYMDAEDYMLRMNQKIPGIFEHLDGWAAHAYPQPEFSGDYYNPPSWYGIRDQIKSYEWELELLQKHFGISDLPVFITETGWVHAEGNAPKWQYKSSSVTATYFDDAFRNIWGPDDRVVAITPFIFNHKGWTNFNWMNDDGYCFPQCDILKNIPKTAGQPILKTL